MADNNQVNVQYGLDVSQATAEAAKLSRQINGITTDLLTSQKTIESNLKSLLADITAAFTKVKAGSAQMNTLLRREDRVFGNTLSSQGRGGNLRQINNAAAKSLISDANNSADQITARLTDAYVTAFQQRMRNVDKAVEARIRQVQYNTNQLIANADPTVLNARGIRDDRNRSRLVSRFTDPELLRAEDVRREAARRKLLTSVNDIEDQNAREKLAEAQRASRIRRANTTPDTELLGAQELRNQRTRLDTIQREKDTLDLEARRILADQARERRLNRAGLTAQDEDLAAAQKSRNDRRRLELIKQEKDNLDLENRRILAEAARTRRAQRAQDVLNPPAPTEKAAPLTLAQRTERGFESTFSRLNSNGGADIVSVQARILAGYASLSLAFQSLRSLGTFVVDLDKQFRQFQAITATTSTEMEGLKDRLIEVSQQSKFSAVEIAEAAVILGQAGLSTREVAESINAVQLLATAAGTDLNSAVDIVTSTMSIFNLQTTQTTDVANTLSAALNLSKLDLDKLTLGMQYSGNIAAQVGITYQELTGVLGALANSGIRSGSTLGTGLRQLIIDIQNPTEKFTKTLKQLGLTQQDVSIESNGLIPVLKTLKEAGFGTGEAFESFEVRAAAAFAALSNNTELAVRLQQQFTLSTAAIEANEVQMDSLANTFSRFTSVIGVSAYRAFEPFIGVLQRAIKTITDFVVLLDKIPALLPIVGTALATGGTALVLGSISALVRGIVQAIPLLSTLTGGIGVATAATAGLGATGAATTGIIGGLFSILRAHPFILITSVIVGAITAMNAFGGSAETATSRIDALRAQVNEFNGQTDAANDQITAINQTIANLVRQKTALDKDPLIRQAKILEVKQGFKEIADQVDTATGSVEGLINALRDLANSDFKKMTSSIAAAIQANDALISGYQLSITEQLQKSPDNIRGTANTVANLIGNETPFLGGSEGIRDQNLISGYAQIFGEKMAQYAAMAMNQMALPSDVSDVTAIGSNIDAQSNALASRQNVLRNRLTAGGRLTSEEAEVLKNIPAQLELLKALKENLQPLIAARLNIATTETNNSLLQTDLLKSEVRSDDRFTGLAKQGDSLTADLNAAYNQVLKDTASQPADVAIKALQKLETEFKGRIATLVAQSEELVTAIAEESGSSEEDVRGAMADLIGNLKNAGNKISTRVNTTNLEFQKLEAARLADEMSTLDDQLGTFRKQLSRSNTAEEIEVVRQYMLTKFDAKRKLLDEIYQAKGAATEDTTEQATIANELREKQKQINIDEQEAIAELTQASVDQQLSAVNETKAAIDEQITATRGKLTELLEAISNARPGPAMDALIAQFNTLSDALDIMQGQSNALGITSGIGSTLKKVIPEQQTAKANQAMQLLMTMGYTKAQAAGITGNLIAESGLSTTAVGDNGRSVGLAQWNGSRQNELMSFAKDRGTTADDFETQIRFIDMELKKYAGLGLKELMASRSAGEAADVFRRLYERPTSDPVVGQHGERVAYANTLGDTDFAAQTAAANQQQLGLITATYNARINAVDAKVSSAQNALTAAQAPGAAQNFTGAQMTDLQRNLTLAQQAAETATLAANEERLAAIRKQLAEATAVYGQNSEQALFWASEEAKVIKDVTAATEKKNAADAALIATGPTVDAAIRSATQAWMIQNGLLDELTGKMIPLAKQVEQVWGSVLDTMTDSFSNLFINLVSGTMTAQEAFQSFFKSVLDGLAQIIAKQLALQIVSSMMGGDGGGGGDFLSALFGVPGAAQGEIIKGGPPRDMQLRRVMPGEAILRTSAVNAIGADNISALNSMGNRSMSQSPISPMATNDNSSGGGDLNVWVVSPDQVPPPGPNDIIAVVADNINRRGQIKQLIQSVARGT